MFLFLLKKSDIIITHAKDGVTFGKSFSRNLNPNIHFFPHPTIPYNPQKSTKVEHDILIWGAISEYKGIDKFLAFLHDRELEKKYRILIAGKISNKDYKQKLLALCNENIQLEDDFIERDVLAKMIQEARLVLFTYSNESVLSSGALIDTLAYEGKIVGPNTGSFKDLAEEQLIEVYNEFEELPDIIDRILAEKAESSVKKLDHYFEKTSWAEFESTINRLINA